MIYTKNINYQTDQTGASPVFENQNTTRREQLTVQNIMHMYYAVCNILFYKILHICIDFMSGFK